MRADPQRLHWFKSSYSSPESACITAARLPGGGMAVKDSKRSDSPVLTFPSDDWTAFVRRIKTS
jgi:hypothetical protein